MATLTISAAARICHRDRRTLQRATHADRLHLDAQHCLSREELIATGYLIVETPQEAPQVPPHYALQETPQEAPQPSPQILGTYDPHAAAVWIRDLRRQGLSYTLIAVQLTREGIPTRYGKPWEHSSVCYVYETTVVTKTHPRATVRCWRVQRVGRGRERGAQPAAALTSSAGRYISSEEPREALRRTYRQT